MWEVAGSWLLEVVLTSTWEESLYQNTAVRILFVEQNNQNFPRASGWVDICILLLKLLQQNHARSYVNIN